MIQSGYKKIVEKLIHESDHFAPTPNVIYIYFYVILYFSYVT